VVQLPSKFGISNPRPIKNPVGVTGLLGAVAVLVVTALAFFNVDETIVQTVAAVFGALGLGTGTVIYRQPPPSQPPS